MDESNAINRIGNFWRRYKSKYLITPAKLIHERWLNIGEITNLLNQYITPLFIEYCESKNSGNYSLEPNIMEFIVQKALNGRNVSAGHSPIDIIIDYNNKVIGIDVACLSLSPSSNMTNEKSIMQTFNAGNDLDTLFNNKQYNEITNKFTKALEIKLLTAMRTNQIDCFYYLIFISRGNKVFLSLYKINVKNIEKMQFDRAIQASIIIKKAINKNIGSLKIYKSKKRIELRLSKDVVRNSNTIQLH